MTVPARRPEDQQYMDALDRLDDYLGRAERLAYEHKAEWVGLFQGGTSDLATVREALERQREERDGAREALESNAPLILDLTRENRRLTEGLRRGVAIALVLGQWDGAIGDRVGQETWDALYDEGLLALGGDQSGERYPCLTEKGIEALRALLSASPSDGPDDFCEHGYTTENAAHPSAGLERCPTCSPTDGGGV